jgi:hypothetical protein
VANIKEAKIGDSDGDGRVELIVGLTDRVLRTYQWCSEMDFEEGAGAFDKHPQEGEEKMTDDQRSEVSDLVYNGKLRALNKWEFANQIGSIALHHQGKSTCILVGQPGGTVSKISNVNSNQAHGPPLVDKQGITFDNLARSRNISSSIFNVEHFTLNLGKIKNPNASTEVVGNIFPFLAGEEADHYAVATLDGTIMLCHEDSFEIVTQLEEPVLALESCNGSFVVVGWEGETYLVKRSLHSEVENCIINFNFEESVASFKVGPYALSQNVDDDGTHLVNKNCFVYATFHESIYIYPNQYL